MGKLTTEGTRISLGDVVNVVTDYWDRSPDVPERFVAGEHIDEGDVRVRRWGMTNDEYVPPTFNRRFQAGDVLFHSRNLKKLAWPSFSGITGEKLFVLRSRDTSRLLPDLLPFLLQTRAFKEYVNRMWAGSTNKFLNKSPLVKYEFVLPPMKEQRRIAALMESASMLCNALRDAKALTITLTDSFCADVVDSIPTSQQRVVGDLSKFSSGASIPVTGLPQSPTAAAQVPVYGGNGLAGYTIVPLPKVRDRTVVVGRVGQYCGVATLTNGPAWVTDNALYPVEIAPAISVEFLALCLRGRHLNRGKLGEYLPLITQKVVHSTLIPVLSHAEQRRCVDTLVGIEAAVDSINDRLSAANRQYAAILGEAFL